MLKRVGIWTLAGFAVGLFWAAVFYMVGPSRGFYPSQGNVLHALGQSVWLRITAPVALLGQDYAITWYWSAVINAAVYGCIGLIVETGPAGGSVEPAAATPLRIRLGSGQTRLLGCFSVRIRTLSPSAGRSYVNPSSYAASG